MFTRGYLGLSENTLSNRTVYHLTYRMAAMLTLGAHPIVKQAQLSYQIG
jgi:hypothetical protein